MATKKVKTTNFFSLLFFCCFWIQYPGSVMGKTLFSTLHLALFSFKERFVRKSNKFFNQLLKKRTGKNNFQIGSAFSVCLWLVECRRIVFTEDRVAIFNVQVSHNIRKFSECLGKIGMLFEISRMFNCFVDDIERSGSGFLTSNSDRDIDGQNVS